MRALAAGALALALGLLVPGNPLAAMLSNWRGNLRSQAVSGHR